MDYTEYSQMMGQMVFAQMMEALGLLTIIISVITLTMLAVYLCGLIGLGLAAALRPTQGQTTEVAEENWPAYIGEEATNNTERPSELPAMAAPPLALRVSVR